jgi:hypothetical protein
MIHPTQSEGLAEGLPLTHEQCITTARALEAQTGTKAALRAQVRRHSREGSYVLCARLLELAMAADGGELFKVDTDIGPMWATGRNLRMCSGDGRCTCDSGVCVEGRPC